MKVVNARWIIMEKETEGGKIGSARLVARGFLEKKNKQYGV